MISAEQTPADSQYAGYQTARRSPNLVVRRCSEPNSSSKHPRLRLSAIADLTARIPSAPLQWLCLVVAIWFLAFEFQLAVGAHSSDSARLSGANPTVGPYR